jgi:NADPH-dependent 2,4-dienoyl-CoA reductase/sulfur reductase-like enzyme/nitrite reductase/ring-hydroxylating ferredoxin subunit
MSDAPPTLAGPDLRSEGLAWNELADGALYLAHAGTDPVLLARRGDAVFAVGAQCTHYSGPLDQGLFVGETVRCPLHHACFDLRTGTPLRAPALSPLPCWPVERRNGRIYVGDKRERDPLAPLKGAQPAAPPASVVILGAGGAGAAAAEMLRREGYEGPVTIVDEEPDSPYDRPNLSKDYLSGQAPAEWIPLRPPGFYDAHRITIRRARAAAIDVAASAIRLADGGTVPFAALLVATGAEPVALTVPGADRPHVHYLRSLADSTAIIRAAERATRAVVVGSSFIGLEVAASLRHRGLEVDVVSTQTEPLLHVFGPQLAAVVRARHEAHGVRFHMGAGVTRIDERAVVLRDGTSLDAELVVVGIGVRPRVALADAAGLRTDRGIAVDAYLRTSVPAIWAAGDVARWPDPHTGAAIRVEHWVVAERMGQTAARNILGRRERFDAVPFFWSVHYDMSIDYVGHADQWERVDVTGDLAAGDGSATYRSGAATLAVASIGQDRVSLEAEFALETVTAPAVK